MHLKCLRVDYFSHPDRSQIKGSVEIVIASFTSYRMLDGAISQSPSHRCAFLTVLDKILFCNVLKHQNLFQNQGG